MIKSKLVVSGIILTGLIIVVLILTHYARSAETVDSDRTAWLTSTLIAHRGVQDQNIPENSFSAFQEAIDGGYIIEMDVSMTKDNQLVVFHDKKLKRLFNIDTYLKDITYEELSKLKLPGSDETVPLFSEFLTFVNGKVPLLIEIKNEGKVGEMESMIYNELKNYQGQYAIQSFNPFTVKWFRLNAPEVLRGQLSGSFIVSDYEYEYAGTTRLPWYKKFLLSNLLFNFTSKPNFISYEIKYTNQHTINGLKKLGVPILGWTIDDQAEYDSARNAFNNFIVNTVDLE